MKLKEKVTKTTLVRRLNARIAACTHYKKRIAVMQKVAKELNIEVQAARESRHNANELRLTRKLLERARLELAELSAAVAGRRQELATLPNWPRDKRHYEKIMDTFTDIRAAATNALKAHEAIATSRGEPGA